MAVKIPLSSGRAFAIVDDEDAERVLAFKWCLKEYPKHRYALSSVRAPGGSKFLMHRIILGALAGQIVDHIDGDGLNNRRSNLRIVSRSGNASNCFKRPGGSPFKGVYPVKNRWRATIGSHAHLGRAKQNLGRFDTPEEAARAYDAAARRLFGPCARVNFPLPGEQGCLRLKEAA